MIILLRERRETAVNAAVAMRIAMVIGTTDAVDAGMMSARDGHHHRDAKIIVEDTTPTLGTGAIRMHTTESDRDRLNPTKDRMLIGAEARARMDAVVRNLINSTFLVDMETTYLMCRSCSCRRSTMTSSIGCSEASGSVA